MTAEEEQVLLALYGTGPCSQCGSVGQFLMVQLEKDFDPEVDDEMRFAEPRVGLCAACTALKFAKAKA